MPLDFFERMDAQLRKKLPFVVYRKPREVTIKAICQADDHLRHVKTYAEKGFVFAPFDVKHPPVILVPDEMLEISNEELQRNTSKHVRAKSMYENAAKEAFPDVAAVDRLNGSGTASASKTSHIRLIENGISAIAKGVLKKVVLSRCIAIDSKTLPLDLFQRLLAMYPNAFCYIWYHPKVGLWLGATPEILLMLRNRHLTTMSLAGTQKYTGAENPKWGRKEREEQQLVTDYITSTLAGQVEKLSWTNTETIRAGELLHLRTKITGLVDEKNLASVISALHPTPAVCGMPKRNAQDFITSNEDYHREYYTGFLGELNLKADKQRSSRKKNQENQAYRSIAKTTTLYVNLRCMQLKNDKAYIYVGGGITKDSDPEREWEETVAKSKTMLKILG